MVRLREKASAPMGDHGQTSKAPSSTLDSTASNALRIHVQCPLSSVSLWSHHSRRELLISRRRIVCPAEKVRIRQSRVHRVEGYGNEADATPKSATHSSKYVHTSARTGVTYKIEGPRYLEDFKGSKRKKRYISVRFWLSDSFRLQWDRIVLDYHGLKWGLPAKGQHF